MEDEAGAEKVYTGNGKSYIVGSPGDPIMCIKEDGAEEIPPEDPEHAEIMQMIQDGELTESEPEELDVMPGGDMDDTGGDMGDEEAAPIDFGAEVDNAFERASKKGGA